MKCKFLLALAAGAMSAVFAQQAAAQPECTVGTAGYMTIQDAVDEDECRTIIVPAGTYIENVIIDRDVTIRGAGPKLTTVDGSGATNAVFVIEQSTTGSCSTVRFVTLEGMTITGGQGPQAPMPHRNGGGVNGNSGVDLVVNNCVITGNSADWNGGGISVAHGRLTVIDSVISRNTALANATGSSRGGGGLRVVGCPSELTVVNSVIEQNESHDLGGGILIKPNTPDRGRLILKDSDVRRNVAWTASGGGGVYFDGAVVTLSDSKVKKNDPNDVQDGPPTP